MLLPLVATLMVLWPSFSSGLSRLQTDPGDTLLNLYFLEHAYKHFTTSNIISPDKYWSPGYFWPVKGTLAWSDHLLGPSVIYAAWRFIFNPFTSYLAWISSTLILNYVSLRYAMVRISPNTMSIWPSLISLVCAFNPALIQQLGHPQLLSVFIFGPILVGCSRLLNSNVKEITYSDYCQIAIWLLINGFFNIYIFVYSCYCVMVCSVIHLFRLIKSGLKPIAFGINLRLKLSILSFLTVLNLIIYIPYLSTLNVFGRRSSAEIIRNLPKFSSWLYSSNYNVLPSPITPGGIGSQFVSGVEQELFPGWMVIMLFSASLVTLIFCKYFNYRRDCIRWLLALTILFFLCLSIDGNSAWIYISKFLPGASSLRASSRVGLIIILFSSGFIVKSSENWNFSFSQLTRGITYSLVLILGFIGIWRIRQPSFDLTTWKKDVDNISQKINDAGCETFWLEHSKGPFWARHIKAMHVQLRTSIPTLNGYSGHFPGSNWPLKDANGKKAFGWQYLSPVLTKHKFRDEQAKQFNCLVSVHDERAIVQLLDSNEIIFPDLIYRGQFLSLLSTKDDYFIFSYIEQGHWKRFKYIKKNNLPVSVDQTPWAMYSAKIIEDHLRIDYVKKGGNTYWVWKVSLKTGEILSQEFIDNSPKPTNLTANIREPIIFYDTKNLQLANDINNRIIYRKVYPKSFGKWKMILRSGKPVYRNRGSFRIVAIKLKDNIINIFDIDNNAPHGYIWNIDAPSGIFLGQTFVKGNHKIIEQLKSMEFN